MEGCDPPVPCVALVVILSHSCSLDRGSIDDVSLWMVVGMLNIEDKALFCAPLVRSKVWYTPVFSILCY